MPHVLRIAAILFAVALVAKAGEARAAHCGDYVRFGAAKATASQAGETSLPASEPGHGECRQAPAPLAPVPAAPQVNGPGEAMAALVFNFICLGDSRELALDRSFSPVRGFYEPPARPPKFSH